MYGLIKKEMLMMKENLKTLMLLLIIFLGMTMMNESNMTFLLPFMAVMISISTFSYDQFNKWDAYVVTLPNGRKNAVRAKYISTLIFVMISFIISILSLFVMDKCGINIEIDASVSELIGCLLGIIIIMIVMFPIMYKFGVEKGRIALFIICFGVTGAAVLISKNVDIHIPSSVIEIFKNYYKVFIPVITCLLLYLSYRISKRIYTKKEF